MLAAIAALLFLIALILQLTGIIYAHVLATAGLLCIACPCGGVEEQEHEVPQALTPPCRARRRTAGLRAHFASAPCRVLVDSPSSRLRCKGRRRARPRCARLPPPLFQHSPSLQGGIAVTRPRSFFRAVELRVISSVGRIRPSLDWRRDQVQHELRLSVSLLRSSADGWL